MLGLELPYRVLACTGCGQRKLDPQLTDAEIEGLYGHGYFNSGDAEASSKDEWALPSSDYLTEVATGRHDKFSRSLEKLKSLFPEAKSFLDVGAATGDMVHLARQTGLDAEGIEFSAFAVQQAKQRYGLDLQQLPLSDLEKHEYYDLIHLNHVFEHFNDPVAELGHIHRLLKPGGSVYIEIPYQFHVVERFKFRLKPVAAEFSLHSVHHPYFFTPRTIKKVLRDNGFEIVQFSLFAKERYPAITMIQKLKVVLWWLLSLVSVGNYMEIIAIRRQKDGSPCVKAN